MSRTSRPSGGRRPSTRIPVRWSIRIPQTEQNDTRGSLWWLREQRKPLTSDVRRAGRATRAGARAVSRRQPAAAGGGPRARANRGSVRTPGAGAARGRCIRRVAVAGVPAPAAAGGGAAGTGANACAGRKPGPTDDGGPTGKAGAGRGHPAARVVRVARSGGPDAGPQRAGCGRVFLGRLAGRSARDGGLRYESLRSCRRPSRHGGRPGARLGRPLPGVAAAAT